MKSFFADSYRYEETRTQKPIIIRRIQMIEETVPSTPEPAEPKPEKVDYVSLPEAEKKLEAFKQEFHEEHTIAQTVGKEAGKNLQKTLVAYEQAEGTFKSLFLANLAKFISLRERWGGQGSPLHLRVNDVDYGTWGQYCDKYLHITPEYFSRLVKGTKAPSTRSGGTRGTTPDSEKSLYKKGQAEAAEKIVAALQSTDLKDAPATVKSVLEERDEKAKAEGYAEGLAEASKLSKEETGDVAVFVHFAQFSKDPAKMALALQALVNHFQMGNYIEVVLKTKTGRETKPEEKVPSGRAA
jgi:hypothetical protein